MGKRYKHLDIIEIPLFPYLNFYAYAYFMDCSVVNKGVDHIHPFRWIIYDYFSTERPETIEEIIFSNYLCNPLYFFGNSTLLDGWKVVGKNLHKQDFCSPKYVRRLNNSDHTISPDKYKELNWSVFLDKDADLRKASNWITLPWEHIKHLERSGSTSLNALPFRIVLEYMKKNNLHYDITNLNTLERVIYHSCCDIPPYEEIPLEFRQNPIPANENLPWNEPQKLYFTN